MSCEETKKALMAMHRLDFELNFMFKETVEYILKYTLRRLEYEGNKD